ncbi:MAG: CoA-binding protein [Streptosporangiales bacterium]|nr:CoA-binding protein [Streptosporangiales bacterium]
MFWVSRDPRKGHTRAARRTVGGTGDRRDDALAADRGFRPSAPVGAGAGWRSPSSRCGICGLVTNFGATIPCSWAKEAGLLPGHRLRGLDVLFDPRAVAVVGASDDPNKVGGRPIDYLRRYGYRGSIYPINPRRSTVQGIPAYPSLDAVTEDVDLAIVATPASTVLETVEACARKGVKVCVVLSSGFGEMGAEGKQAEARIAALAERRSMRVLGPNCQGAANLSKGSVASFSSSFADHHVADGAIAIVSQSGAVAGMLSEIQHAHPTGIRYWAATGNEADVGVPELIGWTVGDPDVRVVEAYCEQLTDVATLADAAADALAYGKAILMVKAGSTPEGRRAAGSHTGALAQEEPVVDAFLRQHGIVRAEGLSELSELARVFTIGNVPPGDRVAILSNSGGLGVMMADRCRGEGLRLATLTEETQECLRRLLPPFAATGNPVDLTTQLLGDSRLFSQVLPALVDDPGVDIVLLGLGMMGRGYDVATITDDIVRVHQTSDLLVAVSWIGGQEGAAEDLARRGVPTFFDDAACVRAVARYAEHCARVRSRRATGTPARPPETAVAAPPIPDDAVPGPGGFLSEHASKRLMRTWGLPTVRGGLVRTPDEAVAAAGDLGYPVVVKLSSPAVAHKTELGMVKVDLRDDDEVRRTAADLLARAREGGVTPVDGLLVEEMVTGGLAVSLGATWDDTFGPIVLVGSGGIHVEATGDFRLLFPPFDAAAVHRALESLAIFPLLRDLRGVGPLDAAALAELVLSVGRLFAATDGRLPELDLNPVFVLPDGAVIADALIRATGPD